MSAPTRKPSTFLQHFFCVEGHTLCAECQRSTTTIWSWCTAVCASISKTRSISVGWIFSRLLLTRRESRNWALPSICPAPTWKSSPHRLKVSKVTIGACSVQSAYGQQEQVDMQLFGFKFPFSVTFAWQAITEPAWILKLRSPFDSPGAYTRAPSRPFKVYTVTMGTLTAWPRGKQRRSSRYAIVCAPSYVLCICLLLCDSVGAHKWNYRIFSDISRWVTVRKNRIFLIKADELRYVRIQNSNKDKNEGGWSEKNTQNACATFYD